MPRSQAQRLRCQLAASRDEVRALEQQITQLGAASAAAAQERAVTERLMLKRLADADARCLEAEQRATAAEIRLLQYPESEQRTGLMEGEDSALGEVCDMFPEVVECACRAELVAAEEAAWEKMVMEQDANREAVKRRRKSLRKKRQKERKRELERRKHGEPTLQGGDNDEFATAHSVGTASESASSTPEPTYNALFVDNICFWIAAFVPYSWAPVCSKAARTVFRVLHIYEQGWLSIGAHMGRFQTMGYHYVIDHEHIGPEIGLPYEANLSVQALRDEVFQLMYSNLAAAPPRWASRWMLLMDFQTNMYEKLRLEHKKLYMTVRDIVCTSRSAAKCIGQALEAFDQREQAEDDEVGAADAVR